MASEDKKIYWFSELGQEDANLVGEKCANLGELTKAGWRTPPGFALAVGAYEDFLRSGGIIEEIRQYLSTFRADPSNSGDMFKYEEAANVIRGIVESKKMPEDMENIVTSYYEELCQRVSIPDVAVATRSAGPASHPGQYETYLHIRGKSEVLKNIIKVWGSTFNMRSLIARDRLALPLEIDPIGVAVLQMVNARSAGVMFTLNAINGDPSKIMIGGNWGLGESVVSGEVTNDQWVVDKVTFEIIERRVATKTIEYEFAPQENKVTAMGIPRERQTIPCLSDGEIIELARMGKDIEQHFGKAQDIEWAIDKGLLFPQNVFVVQTRPEAVWSEKERGQVLETKSSFVDYLFSQ